MWHILWPFLAQSVAMRRRIGRLRVRTLAILELPLHFLFRGIAWARIHGLGVRAHGFKAWDFRCLCDTDRMSQWHKVDRD